MSFVIENSQSSAGDIRSNADLARLHTKAATLLRKIAQGDTNQRDLAMASIYADQLDRRRRRIAVAQQTQKGRSNNTR